MRTTAHGLSIDAPDGWDVRISQTPEGAPILHVATFALRSSDGGFGAAATQRMGADSAFAALVSYQVDAVVRPGVGLFGGGRWSPELRVGKFSPQQLEVTRPGQLGHQRFFTEAGRPFCLYAVVSPARRSAGQLVGDLAAVLATLRFSP